MTTPTARDKADEIKDRFLTRLVLGMRPSDVADIRDAIAAALLAHGKAEHEAGREEAAEAAERFGHGVGNGYDIAAAIRALNTKDTRP